ncbi:MAG: excinuclease ABC subunit UvrC [Candidatus Eisenbacteria bacterium]|nr:excinuclease ABC subunit UvrC [Candidatus Eisenbacteria bacterium]
MSDEQASAGLPDDLASKLDLLPEAPGVYLLRDARGRILYIGKAKRLRHRVRSYFQPARPGDPRRDRLVEQVRDLDTIVTASEAEALVLEANLIKSHAPRYNVELKDDKKYPFVKVGLKHAYPRIEVTRRVVADGARYFGPYVRVRDLRKLMRALRRLFPLRSCTDRRLRQGGRECLDYFIDLCPAPCTGRAEGDAYQQRVRALLRFLEGRGDDVVRAFEKRMHDLAAELRYEESARLRDDLQRIRVLAEPQQMTDLDRPDMDAIGFAVRGSFAAAQVLSHRAGHVERIWRLHGGRMARAAGNEVLSNLLVRHYQGRGQIPPLILCSQMPGDAALLAEWLGQRAGRRVRLHCPRRGPKRNLVQAAQENAVLMAEELALMAEGRRRRAAGAIFELQSALDLATPPYRIEGYDISNVQGRHAVGSQVLFVDAAPRRSGYRRYRIREVKGADDFAMLAEVLRRRARRFTEADAERPDLILIDGGRGQVARVVRVLREAGAERIPVIGLAKRAEEIFRSRRREPLRLPRRSAALQLLQRVRDEAHRFAVSYHRDLRSRDLRQASLEAVSGLGPRKRAALLRRFGSYAQVAMASRAELEAVPGIGPHLAEKLQAALQDARRRAAPQGAEETRGEA